MTFSEKLIRLRKREGLSQEALAEMLGISRQAVSRWEQGTALPDGGKLLPCARQFGVSVDWLLDEDQGWEDMAGTDSASAEGKSPAICKNWHWYLSGGIVAGAGVLGMVVMGILSSLFPVVLTEAPVGVEWTRVYTGLMAFLKGNDVEWLFALWAATALVGLWLLAQPSLRRREKFDSPVSPWYAAGIAAAAYGCGQTACARAAHDHVDRAHFILVLRRLRGGSSLERGNVLLGRTGSLECCRRRIEDGGARQICAVDRGDVQRLVLHDQLGVALYRRRVQAPGNAAVFLVLRHFYGFDPVF